MDEEHHFMDLPRLKIRDTSDQTWETINETLAPKFRIINAQLAEPSADLGAIAGDISKWTYETVKSVCGTIEKPGTQLNNRPKQKVSSLLRAAKEKVIEARNHLKHCAERKTAMAQLNQALRAHNELSRKFHHKWIAKEQSQHEKRFRKDFYRYVNAELKDKSDSKQQPAENCRDQVTDKLRTIYSRCDKGYDISWWKPFNHPTVELCKDPVRPSEVRKTVSKMSHLSAPGPDGIQPVIIKKLPSLQHVLATLFSRLIATSVVPTSWQRGTMIFLYKKGDKNDIANYGRL